MPYLLAPGFSPLIRRHTLDIAQGLAHGLRTTLLGAVAALAATSAAHAAGATNLGSVWLFGDTAKLNSSTWQMSTAAADSGETPVYTSGNGALWLDTVQGAQGLESQLGLAGGTLGSDAYEGSGLLWTFNAVDGAVLSLNWTLATDAVDAGFLDRAVLVIDGATTPALLAPTSSLLQNGSFNAVLSGSGAHSVAIALLDVNDVAGISTLQVDTLDVSAVPEPSVAALLAAGLAIGLLLRAGRRQQSDEGPPRI